MTGEKKARDIMHADVISIPDFATVPELMQKFKEHSITGVPVVNASGDVVGVVSVSDVLRYNSEAKQSGATADFYSFSLDRLADFESMPGFVMDPEPSATVTVREIMTDHVLGVDENDSIARIASVMVEHHIHRVLVFRAGKMAGIITTMDILRAISAPA